MRTTQAILHPTLEKTLLLAIRSTINNITEVEVAIQVTLLILLRLLNNIHSSSSNNNSNHNSSSNNNNRNNLRRCITLYLDDLELIRVIQVILVVILIKAITIRTRTSTRTQIASNILRILLRQIEQCIPHRIRNLIILKRLQVDKRLLLVRVLDQRLMILMEGLCLLTTLLERQLLPDRTHLDHLCHQRRKRVYPRRLRAQVPRRLLLRLLLLRRLYHLLHSHNPCSRNHHHNSSRHNHREILVLDPVRLQVRRPMLEHRLTPSKTTNIR